MNEGFSFQSLPMAKIGEGTRRMCYRMPDASRCVKFYRTPDSLPAETRPSVRFEIMLARHFRRANINIREWQYHNELKRRLPAGLMAAFPEFVEPVYCPEKGWGLSETLILNTDGSLPRRVMPELVAAKDPAVCAKLYRETERLLQALAAHNVCFFDPHNILVQWTGPNAFRLRIVDFEPCDRSPLPCLTKLPLYVRSKVERRAARYLARLRLILDAKHMPIEPAAGAQPHKRFTFFTRLAHSVGLF